MTLLKNVRQRLVLTGLLLGVVTGLPRSADANERSTGKGEDVITTLGYGELRVRPDSLRTSIGVETRAATLEKARNEVNTRMQKIIQALNSLRIPSASLQTQTLQFYPIYSEERDKPRKITGYNATNRISVTVLGATPTDLSEHAARIIDTALSSGANVVGGIDFFLRDTSAVQGQALAAAVDNAGKNARAMADAAKVKLTKLHSLEESSEGGFTPLRFEAAARIASGTGTPIETGEIVVSSNVTARFCFSK
jgi:uncharacterized protein YggE